MYKVVATFDHYLVFFSVNSAFGGEKPFLIRTLTQIVYEDSLLLKMGANIAGTVKNIFGFGKSKDAKGAEEADKKAADAASASRLPHDPITKLTCVPTANSNELFLVVAGGTPALGTPGANKINSLTLLELEDNKFGSTKRFRSLSPAGSAGEVLAFTLIGTVASPAVVVLSSAGNGTMFTAYSISPPYSTLRLPATMSMHQDFPPNVITSTTPWPSASQEYVPLFGGTSTQKSNNVVYEVDGVVMLSGEYMCFLNSRGRDGRNTEGLRIPMGWEFVTSIRTPEVFGDLGLRELGAFAGQRGSYLLASAEKGLVLIVSGCADKRIFSTDGKLVASKQLILDPAAEQEEAVEPGDSELSGENVDRMMAEMDAMVDEDNEENVDDMMSKLDAMVDDVLESSENISQMVCAGEEGSAKESAPPPLPPRKLPPPIAPSLVLSPSAEEPSRGDHAELKAVQVQMVSTTKSFPCNSEIGKLGLTSAHTMTSISGLHLACHTAFSSNGIDFLATFWESGEVIVSTIGKESIRSVWRGGVEGSIKCASSCEGYFCGVDAKGIITIWSLMLCEGVIDIGEGLSLVCTFFITLTLTLASSCNDFTQ